MKLHLPTGLRAALIAALTAVGFTLSQAQAFENATWTFENSMEAQTNITGLSYTWKGGGEAAYVDSGMVAGTKVGDYTLTDALGKAITFGSGQYIQVGNVAYWTSGDGSLNVDNNAKNSYTVIAWVKFDAIAGEQEFFGTSDNPGKGIGFGAKAGTVDALTKYVAHNTIGTQSVTANQWVNIAFSYNKDTDTMTAYVNGDSVGSVSFNGFNSPGGDASIIGGSATNADRTAFAGQIAELSILSGAYDQEQILAAAHLSAGEVTTYTWAGTEQNHNLTSNVWSDGESSTLPYSATDPLIFGTSGCKTVTISGTVTSKSIEVQAGEYTFENSGSLTMRKLIVDSGASLALAGTGAVTANSVNGDGTINIASDVTLVNSATTVSTATVALTGEGVYALGSGLQSLGSMNASDFDGWVRLNGNFVNLNLDGNLQGVNVELKGVTGYFKDVPNNTEAVFDGDLRLTDVDDTTPALKVTNGYSRNNSYLVFSGAVSGSGTWELNLTATQHYAFSGNISGWDGEFLVTNSGTGSGGTSINFRGSATNVNATMACTGGMLKLVAETNVTFNKTINVTELNVASGKKATLNTTEGYTFGGIITGDGALCKDDTGTVTLSAANTYTGGTTVTAGTLKATAENALGTGAITVDAAGSLDLAVGNALGSTQAVTNAGNVIIHKTLTSGTISGGKVTVEMESSGGLEDADGSRESGNGFSLGGEVTVRSATAGITDLDAMMYGDKDCLSQYNYDTGILTLGEEDWDTYQINQVNASQPAVQAIMDYASKNGGTLEHIIVNVPNPEWEPDLTVNLTNNSDKLKASMLGGEHLYNLRLNMADGANLTIDGDCAATIGTEVGANASIALTTDATIGSLSVAGAPEEAAVQLTITGKDHTLKTGGLGLGFDATLTIDEGVKVELLPETSFGTIMNATVKLGAKAALVLNEVSFATVADGTEATIEVISDEYIPMYAPHIAEYNLTGARITFNTSSDFELGHVIDSTSQVVNAGSGKMTDVSSNAEYDELAAQGGDIDLTNKESGLALRNLTLGDNRTVAMQTEGSIITVSGTAKFGSGATVGAALTMANGSTLEGKPASLESHALVLGAAAGDKLNIGDTLWSALDGMSPKDTMNLFTGVSALTLAGAEYDKTKEYDLTSIFSHGTDIKSGKYSLSYENNNVIITRAADNDRYWKGGDGDWNTTESAWKDDPSATDYVTFANGYNAYFTDTTGGTVTLGTDITAASITVSGANYTFEPGSPAHTLTVTDSVEVSGDHTATFNMGLSGADTLKLVAKDKGKLVLNENSRVKTVEIGADSTVTAGKTLAVEGDVVNNGTLEANGTTSITGGLTLGDQSTVAGSATVSAASVALAGNATVSGKLSTGALSGTSTLRLSSGSLTFTAANDLTDKVHLVTQGTTTITSDGVTLKFKDTVENISGTVTFVGQFDVGNCTTEDGEAVYVEGGDSANGFKKAQKIVSVITAGTAKNGASVTFTYNGQSRDSVSEQGKITFDGATEYDKFYVNKSGSTEKVSTATGKFSPAPGTFVLADNTTLEADANIAMGMVTLATDAAANLVIDANKIVTTDGTTKTGLTLKGTGELAVASGKTTTGVTLDEADWKGTVSFTEAELATLSGAFTANSTVSLKGVTGSLGSDTVTGKLILNKGTGDWGFGQTATDVSQITTIAATITGDGNLGVKSGTVDSTFNLNGDINSWNGNFIVATDADTTLNLGGSGAKTVNGTVSGTNLEVNVNADTTFSGALNVEKLTVGNSKKATLQSDSIANEVSALSGSTLKVDDGKKLTVTSNVVPGGLVLGVDSSIVLQGDAVMSWIDYGYFGGTIANTGETEQAMDLVSDKLTVTDTTLMTGGTASYTVNNKLVNVNLFIANELTGRVSLNNVESMELVSDLDIGSGGFLRVANGANLQNVIVGDGKTLTLGDGATLDANVEIASGATMVLNYDMDGTPVATTLNGGDLTLGAGITLSGSVYDTLANFSEDVLDQTVTLFSNVNTLVLDGTTFDALYYFKNMEEAGLGDKGAYTLEFNDNALSIHFVRTDSRTLTWNGTDGDSAWVADNTGVQNWLDTKPLETFFETEDNAKFTDAAEVKDVTISDGTTVARNITVSGEGAQYGFIVDGESKIVSTNAMKVVDGASLTKKGEGNLALELVAPLEVTDSTLAVKEGTLYINTPEGNGKLVLQKATLDIEKGAQLSVKTITGDADTTITMDGCLIVQEGSIDSLTAGKDSKLVIQTLEDGRLSIASDTTVYDLQNANTLDLGQNDLTIAKVTNAGGSVIAGTLNLAEGANSFNDLQVNTIHYASGAEGSGELGAVTVDHIYSNFPIPGVVLNLEETAGVGGTLDPSQRLTDEAVTYTLMHAKKADGLAVVNFTLDDATQAVLVRNGLLRAGEMGLENTGDDLYLSIGGFVDDLVWYTSNDETEWGYKVVDETGALTDGANTLNGVQHVVVDSSRTVDVTGVGSEPGLRVRNLAGLDGRTITFSGEEGDTVNLITTEETASNVNLVAQNITVKVGLDELDAMDPVDYKDLRVGNVDLKGSTLAVHAYEDLDAAFTVNSLSGDGNSMLKGRVIVEGKGGAYRGGYENAYVILHENAEQLLYAGKGLTVAGLGAAKLAYVGPEAHMDAIEGINMTVTLNDPKQDNSGATLVLDKASWLVDGTIISGMSAINSGATLDTAGAPNLVQAAGLNLDGTTIILNQDAVDDSVMSMAVNGNGKTKGLYLAHLGAEDSNTDRVLLNGYLYNKYYQNARLQGGKLLVDRRNAFFTEDVVRPTTVNGRAGAGMLDDTLLELNPQATNPQGDLAAVMTALETNAVANPDRVAAAVAGASAAALGHAFNNDVQRQLRAIRNRTTTMGLAECTTHEGLPYVNAWVNAEGDYRKLDADGTLAGYTLSSWGGTIGCDVDLTGRLTVGAAFTVLHGEFTSHSADMCEGDLDRDYVSLFARYGYRAWTHTFVATLGFAKSKVDRTVNYGTGSYTTRGDSDGNAFGFLYEVGYTKALNEDASTCLQPIFNVNYRHSSLGGYTEKGGSDAALSVGSADMDAVTFGLGARLQSIVGTSVYNRATLFEGRVLAKLDAGDRDCTTNSSLIGVSAKRSVKSAEVGAFGVEVGAGLTIPMGETGGSIFMDVTGDFRSGYTEFNGTVGYRFSF